jgi:hypothetical protein
MPFDVDWYDKAKGIIKMTVYGHPTWDEYHEAVEKIATELKATSRRIDMIMDDKVGMPSGNPMPHLKEAVDKLTAFPNFGMSMVVSTRNVALFPQLMMETASRLYHFDLKRYGRFLKTMDEAVASIEADRANTTKQS